LVIDHALLDWPRPRRLILACELNNTARTRKICNKIVEQIKHSNWDVMNQWTAIVPWQIESKQNPTLTWATTTEYKGLGLSNKP
jgi:hypothetical protein